MLTANHELSSQPALETAARLTSAGRGAIAVLRVCGANATWDDANAPVFHPANGRAWSEQPLLRPVYGRWGRDETEDVVVCRLSATEFEVQCHGGDAAVQRLLRDLDELGFATATAEAQATLRSPALDRELQLALSQAQTWRTANLLAEQACGLLRDSFVWLRDVSWTTDGRTEAAARIAELLSWSAFGLHLSRPWSVVLTGRPNVGKSSLINALLGYQRAIVSPQPGTTRDVVTGVTAFDGWPVELADTAGLRNAPEALEAAGIERARNQLATADLRLVLIDVGEPPQTEDAALLAEWPDALIVAHKSDRADAWGDRLPSTALHVSSHSGAGMPALMAALMQRLVPREPPPGTPLPVCERQVDGLRALQTALVALDEATVRELAQRLCVG
jgi:tRNA modification GTPase